MDLLKRNLAPLLPEAWNAIDEEAKRVLTLHLAGRKLVDFQGPFGWTLAAVSTGKAKKLTEGPVAQVHAALRESLPVTELRTPIVLDLEDLDAMARGAHDPNLDEVIRAAERMARAEDSAIFNGYAAGHVHGIVESSPHAPVKLGDPADIPHAIGRAKEVLRRAGVGGPYALALGTRAFEELTAGSEDGYPLKTRVEKTLVDGPIVNAEALHGAVLLSTRGGDFQLTVGQDLSIGYFFHDRIKVELYLTESFTFRVLEPKAAVSLVY